MASELYVYTLADTVRDQLKQDADDLATMLATLPTDLRLADYTSLLELAQRIENAVEGLQQYQARLADMRWDTEKAATVPTHLSNPR